ncbi:retrovirus-related pol polyprotein from transposon TNT 1-94 [Tanacetum coccineum]
MAGSDDDIPPPPPPPPQTQTPTQQAPHTVSTIKLPILKKGEYDIWAMKMEHYLAHTDYPIWEVIQRGNGPVSVSTDTNGVIKEAIKSDLVAMMISKKIAEVYTKERVSIEDANQKFLRVFESDVKGSTALSSSTQNMAFVSENTSSTNDIKGNQDSRRREAWKWNKDKDNGRRSGKQEESKALVTLDGEGVDWTSHSEDEQHNYALMAYNSSGLDTEYESDSDDKHVFVPSKEQETPSFAFINIVKHVKTPRQTVKEQNTCSKSPKPNKKDCSDFHEKRMAKHAELNKRMSKGTDQRENRPMWNNVQRVIHQNQFVPTAVLTRTGRIQVNTARTSGTNTAIPTNAVKKDNIVKPIVNNARPKTGFHKTLSPINRPFNKTIALRTNFSNQKVNTAKVKAVSAVGGKMETAIKPSTDPSPKRLGHMTGNKACLAEYQDFNGGPVAFRGSKGYITGKGKIKIGRLDVEVVCCVKELHHFNLFSVSQMCDKKNKVLFTDTECLVLSPEFKLPDENQVLLRIPRQNNMYSFNLENIVPSGGLACLIAKATIDESNKWHRRLGHVNFKNLNKLVKGNLVREFKNMDFIEICGSKEIKREYSNAKTPQQNGVAERKNRTLIEAARTMLADSFSPNTFWVEAVSTDCYVFNRVLVTKPQNKTPYELITVKSSKAKIAGEEPNKNPDLKTDEKPVDKEDKKRMLMMQLKLSERISIASPYGGLSFTDLTNTDQDDSEIPALEDIYDNPTAGIFTNASYDDEGVVADFTNLETIVNVSPIPTSRINSIHPSTLILGDPNSAVQTRSKVTKSSGAHAFKISEALEDESWVDAMQEELLQFKIQKVWILVDLPYGKKAIGTKWVYKNKKDERGVVVKNKARIEAVRIFLAFTSYMGFIVYQMDVKSAFLYGKIDEEVYVSQPPGFVDPKYPKKVYKVVKALYGLHQAPKAWYASLSTFLLKSGYRRGTIDKTLFIKNDKDDIMLVQVYVDDIIFGSTKRSLVRRTKTLCLVCHILYSGGRIDIAGYDKQWQKTYVTGIMLSVDEVLGKDQSSDCMFSLQFELWPCNESTAYKTHDALDVNVNTINLVAISCNTDGYVAVVLPLQGPMILPYLADLNLARER